MLWGNASAAAQLVVGNDQSGSATIWLIDPTGFHTARALVTAITSVGKPSAMAADEGSGTLYWSNAATLYRAAYAQSGMLTPVTVGTMRFNGSSMSVTGLAFDTMQGRLVGYRSAAPAGFYQINSTDATCTQVVLTPSGTDFGGFDYDAESDAFYGLNDGLGLSGRGLYRIDKPLETPTYTLLTAYPGGETDIDGLAVGGGRTYWINDTPAQPIYVYNLSSASFEATVANPVGGPGTFAAGAFAPGLLVVCATEGCDRPDLDIDFDADCEAGLSDLATLMSHFGISGNATNEQGDTDRDRDVDLTDLASLLSRFGTNCQ